VLETSVSETEQQSALGALEVAPPLYVLPRDDLLSALVPAIAAGEQLDCMMGFFASSSFAEIAPGLAAYLRRSSRPIRLLISPYVSQRDQEAMHSGLADPTEIAERMVLESLPDADDLAKHTLTCLAWLIRAERLEFRIALQKEGLFHPKVWLIGLSGERAAFHGSGNMTNAGLTKNKEQVALARGWMDAAQAATEQRLRDEFNELWDGDDPDCVVVKLPAALEQKILRDYGSGAMPDEADARRLWRRAKGLRPEPTDDTTGAGERARAEFHIPAWLEYETGPFAHQGRAVKAWLGTGGKGILAMATGSGKTLTSLIACWKLQQAEGPLLIVIAAPYVPLVMQWCDEVALFGVSPINLSDGAGPAERRRLIAAAGRRLAMGLSTTEILVVSHDILTDATFQGQLAAIEAKRILIADEMHNLGGAGFLATQPAFFEFRLGLSATPVRQYDPEGTDKLFAFFGQPCFEFSIDEAIGVCLVPYDYYVERVELTHDEMETFKALSDQIRKLGWKIEQGVKDAHLDNLLRQRRLVIETAANKLVRLSQLLDADGARNLRFDLIYATDKAPSQLDAVNGALRERGVLYHQLTAEETRDRRGTATILANYQRGDLQVLTAKRVLDEGVNIPQIKRAFILASTTVERQWVQRRGRILRKCDAIGKTFGVIHDFVAMPPADLVRDPDAKKLVAGELKRVHEFARLARNFGAADGPIRALEEMQGLA
jgi:superfamily II DNA or RNA helicase